MEFIKSLDKRIFVAALLVFVFIMFCYRGYQYNKLDSHYWELVGAIEQPICMLADGPEGSSSSFSDMVGYMFDGYREAADYGYNAMPKGYGYLDIKRTLDNMLTPLMSRGFSVAEAKNLCADYGLENHLGRLVSTSIYAQVRVCMYGSLGQVAALNLPLPGRSPGSPRMYPIVSNDDVVYVEGGLIDYESLVQVIRYTESALPPDFKHVSRSVRCR